MLKRTLAGALLLASVSHAVAQEITVKLDTTAQERAALIQMCELARWASRYQFDRTCDNMRKKIDDAENAAIAASKAQEPTREAPNVMIGPVQTGKPDAEVKRGDEK